MGYNAMGKTINNYPKKPHFIVDVTRPANGCGGCTKYAMKSTQAQQGSWRTKDGSAWWLRDGKYNEPNGDYHANCYLHVYDVNPNNVRFNDGSCSYYTTDYLCQPTRRIVVPTKCRNGSPSNCKVVNLNVKGYSPGGLVRIHNGRRVRKSTETDSCPNGWKVWSPRNKNDWTLVYNKMGKNINNYPKKPHFIIDVTRPANGCGGCKNYAMKSGVSQQSSWRTKDGSAWWPRDSKYNEPSGDYHANCYLHVYDVNPNNVRFNDGSCSYYSTEYLCQPTRGGGGRRLEALPTLDLAQADRQKEEFPQLEAINQSEKFISSFPPSGLLKIDSTDGPSLHNHGQWVFSTGDLIVAFPAIFHAHI